MDSDIEIVIAGDPNHQELIAEIYIGNKYVAHVSQDEGADKLRINFPDRDADDQAVSCEVNLTTFKLAIKLAEERLLE